MWWRADYEKGHRNGISLIIFAGIVARFQRRCSTGTLVNTGEMNWFVVIILVAMISLVVAFIIFIGDFAEKDPRAVMPRRWWTTSLRRTVNALPLKDQHGGVIHHIRIEHHHVPATIATSSPIRT